MRAASTTIAVVMLALRVAGSGIAETPRATDLLRAKRLAEQNARRLRLPRSDASGWRRGGSGWGENRDAPRKSGAVTINVNPPRRGAKDR